MCKEKRRAENACVLNITYGAENELEGVVVDNTISFRTNPPLRLTSLTPLRLNLLITGVASPSFESNVLFAVLTGVYTLFFNFSRDLNSPFAGVYQIRRSQTASYLIKTKRVIVAAGINVDFGYDDDGNRQQQQ